MTKKIELLAPAGSWEAFLAAVQNGADSIYLGGSQFSARQYASNFDNETLMKAVRYAHIYGVKVYVAVNTLIKEKELEQAQKFLKLLYEIGVDAVITQDLGIAYMVRHSMPDMNLHASTQMTIHNLESVHVLEEIGFSRVVLARELDLEEIKNIKRNSDIELEVFIHGALCICYSGQCLMSSIIGGRSGNRGMCAQPCRLPYRLKGEQTRETQNDAKYLLSPKDLCSVDFVDEIIDAGAVSLKIEGRMKRPEYVAVTTKEYRKAIDCISNGGIREESSKRRLLQIFNRGGFSDGYFHGLNNRNMMSIKKPGHWGVYLGKVVETAKGWIQLMLESTIEIGDTIEFWGEGNKTLTQTVTTLRSGNKIITEGLPGQMIQVGSDYKVKRGTEVWITSKESLNREAQQSYQNGYFQALPLTIKGEFKVGCSPKVIVSDMNGLTAEAMGEEMIQEAEKKPLTQKDVIKQLSKLGDTPFFMEEIELEMDSNIFMPLSSINLLRRKCIEKLIDDRASRYTRESRMSTLELPYIKKRGNAAPKLTSSLHIYVTDMMIDEEALPIVDCICYEPPTWPIDIKTEAKKLQIIKEHGVKTRLVLPRITRREDVEKLKKEDKELWKLFDGYQAGNLGMVRFLMDQGIDEIHGDFSFNIYNSFSVLQLKEIGVKSTILSPELTISEIHDIIESDLMPHEVVIYGYIPLMIMDYCPVQSCDKKCASCNVKNSYYLQDRKGLKFPLLRKGISRCYTEILNSQILFVADEFGKIGKHPIHSYGLRLQGQSSSEIVDIIKLHRFVIDNPEGVLSGHDLEVAKSIKDKGFTRGHFFRGVI